MRKHFWCIPLIYSTLLNILTIVECAPQNVTLMNSHEVCWGPKNVHVSKDEINNLLGKLKTCSEIVNQIKPFSKAVKLLHERFEALEPVVQNAYYEGVVSDNDMNSFLKTKRALRQKIISMMVRKRKRSNNILNGKEGSNETLTPSSDKKERMYRTVADAVKNESEGNEKTFTENLKRQIKDLKWFGLNNQTNSKDEYASANIGLFRNKNELPSQNERSDDTEFVSKQTLCDETEKDLRMIAAIIFIVFTLWYLYSKLRDKGGCDDDGGGSENREAGGGGGKGGGGACGGSKPCACCGDPNEDSFLMPVKVTQQRTLKSGLDSDEQKRKNKSNLGWSCLPTPFDDVRSSPYSQIGGDRWSLNTNDSMRKANDSHDNEKRDSEAARYQSEDEFTVDEVKKLLLVAESEKKLDSNDVSASCTVRKQNNNKQRKMPNEF